MYTAAMEVQQLPRGRHRLTREQVMTSQRERMLVAMADAVAELGYAKTTVAEVIRRAGVSRETFYEHFRNKEGAFLAAYDGAAEIVAHEMADELGQVFNRSTATVEEKLEAILGRYLEALASEPAVARTFLVEVYAAGPRALARRVEVQQRFTDLVAMIAGAEDERQRFACEAIVAAVSALVTQRICAGRGADLEELREPVADLSRSVLGAVGLA
jgi:AcrR family transcriptional regulator